MKKVLNSKELKNELVKLYPLADKNSIEDIVFNLIERYQVDIFKCLVSTYRTCIYIYIDDVYAGVLYHFRYRIVFIPF